MGQVMGIEFQFCKMKRCRDLFHNNVIRNSLVVQRLGLHGFLSGAWVWSSNRELSLKLHSTAKTMTTTTKQHRDYVCVYVLVTQLCPTLHPHGLKLTRCPSPSDLEWVAISFSKRLMKVCEILGMQKWLKW